MPAATLTMKNKRTRRAACPLVACLRGAGNCELDDLCVDVWKYCHLALCKRLVTLTEARSE